MQMMLMSQKGISPIVATVLLIAFTVSVAGILITWLSGFATTTTEQVGSTSTKLVTCSQGQINIRNLQYWSSAVKLSGVIENTGLIALGDLALSIIFQNATSQKIDLCTPASSAVSCSSANLTLGVAQQATFNITIGGSNYNEIRVITNCSGVVDTALRGDVVA